MMRGVSVTRSFLPGGDMMEVVHRDSDPQRWMVRRRRNTFFGLRDISSTWFNNEPEARAFAATGAVPRPFP